jgi:hypothetical protein
MTMSDRIQPSDITLKIDVSNRTSLRMEWGSLMQGKLAKRASSGNGRKYFYRLK